MVDLVEVGATARSPLSLAALAAVAGGAIR
jgi:hypothetical protein